MKKYSQPKNIHFICGMSRGGTTWIGRVLQGHPECAVFGESLFWGRNYIKPGEHGYWSSNDINSILHKLEGCHAFIGNRQGDLKNIDKVKWKSFLNSITTHPKKPEDLFTEVCYAVGNLEDKPVVIEKTPHHVNWISRITSHLPQSKFIIMIRDPYGFALSYKYIYQIKKGKSKNHFKRFYHPLSCAIIWKKYYRSALKAASTIPEKTLVVEHRDLHENMYETLLRICEFLKVKPFSPRNKKFPADKNSSFTAARKELDGADYFWINLICKRELSHFGQCYKVYSYKYSEIILSFLSLVTWGFYILRKVPSIVNKGNRIDYFTSFFKNKN